MSIQSTSELLDELVAMEHPSKLINQGTHNHSEYDCPKCHIEMTKIWNEYHLVCPKCNRCYAYGQTGEHHTIGAGDNHNTSNNAFMCFKPVGTKNRLYHNTMIKYTSEQEPYRDNLILNLLKQFNYINHDFKIPLNVLKEACEMFISMRDHDYVRRGKTRRGVLGACIYVKCIVHKITKTKSQIAKMMHVEENKITFGLDELKQYAKLGVIELPENEDPTCDFVDSYFETFDLDAKYKQFVIDLIGRINKKKIAEIGQCHNTTKTIGAVFFLSNLLGLGLTHDMITKNCDNISRGAYLNVKNAIVANEEKLRKVFVRHDMPFPVGWKPIVKKVKIEKLEDKEED